MATQYELDQTYMAMAQELSKLSKANRKKVGCLVVKDTHIISEGVNGTPRGFNNECEYYDAMEEYRTKPETIHAESNAITKLAKSTNSSDGATMYITLCPCFKCALLIIQAGIKRVVYLEDWPTGDGVVLLKEAGIEVCKP